MGQFELHSRLTQDSVVVTKLELCEVRLITDANYPWLILVPQREGIREIHRLPEPDQILLMKEISYVSEKLEALTSADKMNVGALGNMVPQLHVHVIARYESDIAWPGPVWGAVDRKEYENSSLRELVGAIRTSLAP